jgi:putative phosphoribosyl transferase
MRFADRQDAGRRLADAVLSGAASGAFELERGTPPVVVGLPRGGVPVAAEVARALGAPLDVLIVRKLGVPWQPEVGFGALGEDGVHLINQDVVRTAGLTATAMDEVAVREGAELARRATRYRGGRPPVPVAGRTVIVVDDGLATGFTARAAVAVLRARGAGRVVLAVPVAPADAAAGLTGLVDAFVCLDVPSRFDGVGGSYDDFRQTDDEEVLACLGGSA